MQAYVGLDANSDFCYLRTVIFPQSINLSQKENTTESQGWTNPCQRVAE